MIEIAGSIILAVLILMFLPREVLVVALVGGLVGGLLVGGLFLLMALKDASSPPVVRPEVPPKSLSETLEEAIRGLNPEELKQYEEARRKLDLAEPKVPKAKPPRSPWAGAVKAMARIQELQTSR